MLKINDLNVFFGGIHALKGITFDVPKGKVITLVGANGAGKSTTLRTICGLIKPQKGEVKFDNQVINNIHADLIVKKGIALIPEGRKIFPNLTSWVLLPVLIEKKLRKIINGFMNFFPGLKKGYGKREVHYLVENSKC